MAKKSKKSKKAERSKKSEKDERGGGKAQRKADAKQQKQAAAAGTRAAAPSAQPDQVELLKLALRDTEAKLVDAEHRLRQVQQQLDDERRALADAAEQAVEDAVVEAAVEETVAEAVLDAEIAGADLPPADVAEVIAETLDEIVAETDPAALAEPDPVVDHSGEAAAAAAVFSGNGTAAHAELTPPLPEEPAPEVPSEEWTLVRLRQEARRRGLTDTSNLPKARLLERLRGS